MSQIPDSTKFVIFSLENTLTDYLSPIWKSDAYTWLAKQSAPYQLAIAENLGGVGLRAWQIENHFGEKWSLPDLPTAEDVAKRITRLANALPTSVRPRLAWYGCYAYQSRQGHWSPTPEGKGTNDPWDHNWRKPAPGMLLRAMKKAKVTPAETLFVGNSEADKDAAAAAGVEYMVDWDFFGRIPF